MPELAQRVSAIRSLYNQCFGCGLDNPIGLRLDGFHIAGDGVSAHFRPRAEFNGFSGILHGGIIAALLDETMAWSAMLLEGTFVVTASLELKYRKPAQSDADYQVQGRVVERHGRRLRLEANAAVNSTVIAEATGLFLATEPIAV